MIDSSIHEDDPWSSLAEELGVAEKSNAPSEHSHKHVPEVYSAPAPMTGDTVLEEESSGPELLEAPELLDEKDSAEEGEIAEGDSGEVSADGTVKKRRRKRRRGKKKPDGEAPTPEATAAEGEAVAPEANERAPESEADEFHPGAALDEEMEAETAAEKTSWNVTSWKDLIAGLYRPER